MLSAGRLAERVAALELRRVVYECCKLKVVLESTIGGVLQVQVDVKMHFGNENFENNSQVCSVQNSNQVVVC